MVGKSRASYVSVASTVPGKNRSLSTPSYNKDPQREIREVAMSIDTVEKEVENEMTTKENRVITINDTRVQSVNTKQVDNETMPKEKCAPNGRRAANTKRIDNETLPMQENRVIIQKEGQVRSEDTKGAGTLMTGNIQGDIKSESQPPSHPQAICTFPCRRQ